MYFDQFGRVRACCQNSMSLLGDVAHQSLLEIWESSAAQELREQLAGGAFAPGCDLCAWQVGAGNTQAVFATGYDAYANEVDGPLRAIWPRQMEFSLTNTCNLMCTMCSGDLSSTIRSRRDRLPPLPRAYDDAFFQELTPFLPHLHRAQFVGGEPFVGQEPLRVMEMLLALDHPPEVSVVTNGTQWNPRVEHILAHLPMHLMVSIDGMTAATFEAIRVGARFDEVMANLDRYEAATRANGGSVAITHCLMTDNWTEFADLVVFAERRGFGLSVNMVSEPAAMSLYQLERGELERVIDGLRGDEAGVLASVERLRGVWDGQLEALENHLGQLAQSASDGSVLRLIDAPTGSPLQRFARRGSADAAHAALAEARARLGPDAAVIEFDPRELVLSVSPHVLDRLGVGSDALIGQTLTAFWSVVPAMATSTKAVVTELDATEDLYDAVCALTSAQTSAELRMVVVPRRAPDGGLVGTTMVIDVHPTTCS